MSSEKKCESCGEPLLYMGEYNGICPNWKEHRKDESLYIKLLKAVEHLEAELKITTPNQSQLKKDIHELYDMINAFTGSSALQAAQQQPSGGEKP